MDISKRFGTRIQRLRTMAGWSQEELADRTGLHRTYISGVERGVRNPTLLVVYKFALAFSISPSELLDMED
jgi:transcriptional regulator with XRE-family HTH domain